MRLPKIRWTWLPAVVVMTYAQWTRHGHVAAISCIVVGLAIGALGNRLEARRKKRDGDLSDAPERQSRRHEYGDRTT